MARVSKYMVIANIPRYTLKPEEVTDCSKMDLYYLSGHPEKVDELNIREFLIKKDWLKLIDGRMGATAFWGYEAPHCQWFPKPKDGYDLFKKTGLFERVVAEECTGNCGESNIVGYKNI